MQQRILVDEHDRHGLGHALERQQPLVAVEDDVAKRPRRGRQQDEERQRGEEHQSEKPHAPQRGQRSISRPSYAADTLRVNSPRRSSSKQRPPYISPLSVATFFAE